jgi:hypothetical protein
VARGCSRPAALDGTAAFGSSMREVWEQPASSESATKPTIDLRKRETKPSPHGDDTAAIRDLHS